MGFAYRRFQINDTIAALATPSGEGAIAVIRLSGQQAIPLAAKIFSGPIETYASHTAHYGKILDASKSTIDHVLLLVMKTPRSYTGEDTVEISCHGGSLIARRVLGRLYEVGARPAEPGEFSLRAFLNGKIDLAQAEAVQQLIHAKNEQAMFHAEKQLSGALSKMIGSLQHELTQIAAILEAWVDFPEEGLEFATTEEILSNLKAVMDKMEHLQKTFHDGKTMHEGIRLCLIGPPNAGKSSLMNALLRKNRAIVTEVAGTTRDLLEEDLRLGSLHFRLIDTAGIRKTEERIEQEGILRSAQAMEEADLVLLLLDASRPLDQNDLDLIRKAPKENTLIVWNKIDLSPLPDPLLSTIGISAKDRIGLDQLQAAIEEKIWKHGLPSKEEVLITSLRHHQALSQAVQHCKSAISNLEQNASAEFVAADMRSCLYALGSILGTNVTEDILSAIFSKFCLGK